VQTNLAIESDIAAGSLAQEAQWHLTTCLPELVAYFSEHCVTHMLSPADSKPFDLLAQEARRRLATYLPNN